MTQAQISERALIIACREGDREAYSRLVEHYSTRVFAICYGITGCVSDAEDMVQEAFLKGFLSIGSLRKEELFPFWISRIARNLSIDLLRRRKKNTCSLEELPEAAAPSDGMKPEHLDLRQALRRLPEDLRLPLALYYLDGRETSHIAEALGISVDGVHTRLSRARRELRKLLEGGVEK